VLLLLFTTNTYNNNISNNKNNNISNNNNNNISNNNNNNISLAIVVNDWLYV